ncbi:MFS transporter [Candidatus Puniceispirillum sp.]|nr:MFS transporter [Candidatus Puniceispirillum sp.]
MQWLLLALGSMFVQQSFVTFGKVLPAVLAPVIFSELRFDPSWLGVYVGIMAAASLIAQAGCGNLIVRYGALRISQVALLLTGLGLGFATLGQIPLLILSAIAIGAAAASTPASSHLLGRYSPIKQAPLVFSIKQTAVPVGLLIAGFLGPLFTELYGWRNTLLIIAGSCVLLAITLEFLREKFDGDRDKNRNLHLSDFKGTILLVLRASELRSLAFGCFAFVGLQTTFVAYFIIYLTETGYSLMEAGRIFSSAFLVAIPGRILWGWLSSNFINPKLILGFLALGMFVTVSLTSLFDSTWNDWQITLIAAGVTATVFSWHGIVLAEAVRLFPASMKGAVTGGVLSFGQCGGLVLPLIYSVLLSFTGSYKLGFLICALPALFVGLLLLSSVRRNAKLN